MSWLSDRASRFHAPVFNTILGAALAARAHGQICDGDVDLADYVEFRGQLTGP